jgi:hypothetical protein
MVRSSSTRTRPTCPAVGSGEIALDEDAAGVGDADVAEIFVESLTVEPVFRGSSSHSCARSL